MGQTSLFGDDSEKVVNVATVPMHSPFRYPGGKTWLGVRPELGGLVKPKGPGYAGSWIRTSENSPSRDCLETLTHGPSASP
jgi:hypothetical protein